MTTIPSMEVGSPISWDNTCDTVPVLSDFCWDYDSLSTTETADSQQESSSNKLKRRRVYIPPNEEARLRRNARRRKIPIPIIPKNDIRRSIPKMVINVANSADGKLVHGFMTTFCSPQCKLVDYCRQLVEPQDFASLTILEGVDSISHYMDLFLNLAPDSIMKLLSSQIRTKSDGSCTTVCYVSFHATTMYLPQGDPYDIELKRLLVDGNTVIRGKDGLQALGPNADQVEEVIKCKQATSSNWCDHVVLADHPVPWNSDGYMIVDVDPHGFITTFDFVDSISSLEEYYLPLNGC